MFEVKDGARTLQFEGTLLAESSSWRRGSVRWIEFKLFKTKSGSYILSRTGVSLVYHGAACPLVSRYGLSETSFSDLDRNALPCEECDPDSSVGLVFPEKQRHWAQVSEDPGAVLDALYKYDDRDIKYLTHVAQRLLDIAVELDSGIESVYKIEVIP